MYEHCVYIFCCRILCISFYTAQPPHFFRFVSPSDGECRLSKWHAGYSCPVKTILVFLRLFVFESKARTRQTDGRTDERARPVTRPLGQPHTNHAVVGDVYSVLAGDVAAGRECVEY